MQTQRHVQDIWELRRDVAASNDDGRREVIIGDGVHQIGTSVEIARNAKRRACGWNICYLMVWKLFGE